MTCGNLQSSPASASCRLDASAEDYHFAYISQLLSRRHRVCLITRVLEHSLTAFTGWVIYLQHQLVAYLHSIDDISSSISRQLDQGQRSLIRIVSSEWSAACVPSLHSLRASPALPPQHNTFIIDTHHLRDTFNIMSFLHGSNWSCTTSCATAKTRFWSRTALCTQVDS